MSEDQIRSYDHFIGGEFVKSSGDDRLDVEYPYDGSVWATVPDGSEEDVDAAVSVARETFDAWRESSVSERYNVLHSIADAIEDHFDELGELETKQNGKLIREMRAQMPAVAGKFRYYASQIDTSRGDVVPVAAKDGGFHNYVVHEPYGVVGAVTPWNSPLMLTVGKLAPAIATGNTFVHKPSEITPVSALRLAEIIAEESDLPDGVYNVITGAGETGAALTNHDDVDKLTFTGSTATGRKIGAAAGENLIPVSLELGGKSPNIVFPSADLENAVTGAVKGIFAATGQTCIAGSRVFVHDDVYEPFVDAFVERASQITIGDPMDPETELGPVAFGEQWEKVNHYVEAGQSEGGTLLYGGGQPDDQPGEYFFEPTIFTDIDNEMEIARDEIFGPVASVIRFSEEEDVIEQANDTRYGLAAGIWTEDMRQAHRVADAIDAGTVWVNEYRTGSTRAPFGGFKDSGIGRENGSEGLEEYRQTKTVWIDQTGEVSDPFKLG